MPSMWEDLKKTVKEGLSTAAAKTEEFTKIGKAKLDMMNLNKSLNGALQDLGLEVYTQITEGSKVQPSQNPKVKDFIEKINQFKQSIKDKEAEIEAIKKGSGAQPAEDGDPSESAPDTKTKK
jgi:hypothetical protein